MARQMLKNFCIEPETEDCSCTLHRCGGIDMIHGNCPEHGFHAALKPLAKTHFHRVKGLLVGSAA